MKTTNTTKNNAIACHERKQCTSYPVEKKISKDFNLQNKNLPKNSNWNDHVTRLYPCASNVAQNILDGTHSECIKNYLLSLYHYHKAPEDLFIRQSRETNKSASTLNGFNDLWRSVTRKSEPCSVWIDLHCSSQCLLCSRCHTT